MAEVEHYGAIVIGAGQAGVPLAKCLAVEAGLETVLVERAHVGGTCINTGCTPTKTMLASARVAWLARRAAEFGVHAGPVTVDWAAVRGRKDAIVTNWRGGSATRRAWSCWPARHASSGRGPSRSAVRTARGGHSPPTGSSSTPGAARPHRPWRASTAWGRWTRPRSKPWRPCRTTS
jgi:cation diffusion facilitator CzcD-associated flavoprotein CzcO